MTESDWPSLPPRLPPHSEIFSGFPQNTFAQTKTSPRGICFFVRDRVCVCSSCLLLILGQTHAGCVVQISPALDAFLWDPLIQTEKKKQRRHLEVFSTARMLLWTFTQLQMWGLYWRISILSGLLHLRYGCCTFYSTTFVWQLQLLATFKFTVFLTLSVQWKKTPTSFSKIWRLFYCFPCCFLISWK